MLIRITSTALSLLAGGFAVTGCINSHHSPDVAYGTVEPRLSRVSDHDVVRVYPTPTPSAVAAAPGDMAIAGSVGQLLVNRANQIPPNNIRAAVKDGVVTLQGTAPSAELRRDLEDAISQMSGVKRVENKLQLELR